MSQAASDLNFAYSSVSTSSTFSTSLASRVDTSISLYLQAITTSDALSAYTGYYFVQTTIHIYDPIIVPGIISDMTFILGGAAAS
jgi:hypothetical protein